MAIKFYKETNFKDLENTSREIGINKIPKEWGVKRLNEVSNIMMGQSPPSSAYNNRGGGLPFIQGSRDFGDMYPSITTFTTICNKKAPKGSILFSVRAPVGDVNIADRELCIGRGIAAIFPTNTLLNSSYLYYYLVYMAPTIKRQSSGTTFESIKKSDLEYLPIPLPPLEEQKSIADVLSTIDREIENINNLIEKTEKLKKNLMNLLLYGKIRIKKENNIYRFYKETNFKDLGNVSIEIGINKIPKEWEVKKLKDIVIKAKMGGTPSRNISEYWNGDIPFIKAQDITKTGKYSYQTEEYITEYGLKNSNAWIIPKDSLLLSAYGSIGFLKINKIPIATNQQIIGIIPKEEIVDIEFLYYWYLYFQPFWNKFIKTTTLPHLTQEIILDSPVPVPPLEEQKSIADVLSTIDRKIDLLKRKKELIIEVKKWFMKKLLTGEIRIKILENDNKQ
ncbi:type I restriction-modification system, specificity subunit S [Nanobdella aerobiophila]|uniref:Type I restriction-modification system, specificity subunit S n=1 Tax=Nanobdella aerobiophila TaxID=2586965 RepID=A0A915SYE0_9ARCH|nr:restriction endonuclease subunit S [Nanobdella aerobiophila]BBL45740.1 type I restriction-modification system, specificity subunit S [Nanobdella aerobiophila]